jgi:hypothetical protein
MMDTTVTLISMTAMFAAHLLMMWELRTKSKKKN